MEGRLKAGIPFPRMNNETKVFIIIGSRK
jgi:hypothetical protein